MLVPVVTFAVTILVVIVGGEEREAFNTGQRYLVVRLHRLGLVSRSVQQLLCEMAQRRLCATVGLQGSEEPGSF